MTEKTPFEKELSALLNKFSLENVSNTPDYLLAEFVQFAIAGFNVVVSERDRWYMEKRLEPGADNVRDDVAKRLQAEAVFRFGAWLTQQPGKIEIGRELHAGPMAEAAKKFCDEHELGEPSNDWDGGVWGERK